MASGSPEDDKARADGAAEPAAPVGQMRDEPHDESDRDGDDADDGAESGDEKGAGGSGSDGGEEDEDDDDDDDEDEEDGDGPPVPRVASWTALLGPELIDASGKKKKKVRARCALWPLRHGRGWGRGRCPAAVRVRAVDCTKPCVLGAGVDGRAARRTCGGPPVVCAVVCARPPARSPRPSAARVLCTDARAASH